MGGKYKITESVGRAWQIIHDYDDIEKHHPTWKEDPKKRHYADIDGRREEFVYSPSGERMVSKDFVFSVDGKASVDIPSPVEGYVKRSPRMDRWGTVEIYDGPGEDAKLIARVRHMDPIHVKDGEKIEYGHFLGRQSNQSPPGTKVGLHTHMDISEGHLDQFRKYIRDLDAGVITTDGYVEKSTGLVTPATLRVDSVLKQGVQGSGAKSIEALKKTEQTPLLSDPSHPDHALYRQALNGIEKLPPNGFRNDQEQQNAAATLAFQAKANDFKRIDQVVLSTNGTGLFAVQDPDKEYRGRVYVDKTQAALQPIEQSTAQVDQERQIQQQTQSQQQTEREQRQPTAIL